MVGDYHNGTNRKNEDIAPIINITICIKTKCANLREPINNTNNNQDKVSPSSKLISCPESYIDIRWIDLCSLLPGAFHTQAAGMHIADAH